MNTVIFGKYHIYVNVLCHDCGKPSRVELKLCGLVDQNPLTGALIYAVLECSPHSCADVCASSDT